MVLTEEQKHQFVRNGFIVLRNAVSPELVTAALQVADAAYANNEYELDTKNPEAVPFFADGAQKHPAVGGLLRHTQILAACDELLGAGNTTYNGAAQIAFRTFDHHFAKKGMKLTDTMPAHKFHIDGGNGKLGQLGTPFTALVGVCLSGGQDVEENRGQFTVWPGSHHVLHGVVAERVKNKLIKGHNIFGGMPHLKPKIGQPMRVLLGPGDAVIAHQRLGHAGGVNLTEEIRKNLYFRIHHKQHAELVYEVINGSLFTEYEAVRYISG